MIPKKTVIDGYEIKQAENVHVTITRLEDGKTVFHAQCNEEKDAQQMLDFYKGFRCAKLRFAEVFMKGICEKCEYMHKSTVSGRMDGKQFKYCGKYNSWCQSVARNCIFNPDRPNKK